MEKLWDVIVIGGGVVGSAIARELSKYQLSVLVLEKNLDVCYETSGRNSGVVHGGFAYDSGTLKARLCVQGNLGMEQLSRELDFPFRKTGKVLVGNTEEDLESLQKTMAQGKSNGVEGLELIDGEKLHELVPTVRGNFAMWSPNSGIVDPFLYTIALAENAAENGVSYLFGKEVSRITRLPEGHYLVSGAVTQNPKNTGRLPEAKEGGWSCQTRWIINAAGLGAKKISDLLGITGYRVIGSKGHYIILDQRTGVLLPMPVYPVPSNTYMGIHVTPTTDGNVIVGPDAENTDCFIRYDVPAENLRALAEDASRLWPHIEKKDYIRNYCGILPKWVDEKGIIQDFRIEIRDELAPRAVNLMGIESPGLTAAVPIAEYVLTLMKEREVFSENPNFCSRRKGIRRFSEMSREEREAAIRKNPDYGDLICRCQKVSKAEILEAIHNPLQVSTMVSVKYRSRSMMGRCQGGYCQMRIEQMLEQELSLKPEEVLYNREGSQPLFGKVRKEQL